MPLQYTISNKTQGNIRLSYTWDTRKHRVKTLQENHYYPFGLRHHAYAPLIRTVRLRQSTEKEIRQIPPEAVVYKYKYNGKELQDEMGLNVYAYGWRDYDPAIARFNKIDRFAEKYQFLTPYHFDANNPLYFREIAGDSLTENAQKYANQIVDIANSRIKNLNEKIKKWNSKLSKNKKRLTRKINRANKKIGDYKDVIKEINILESSDQWYDVQPMEAYDNYDGETITGKTVYDFKTNMVVMYVNGSDIGYAAHEFLHAYQFETGVMDLGSEGSSNLFYTGAIEYFADNRAKLFGSYTHSYNGGSISYKHALEPSSMAKLYKKHEKKNSKEKFAYRYNKKTYIYKP